MPFKRKSYKTFNDLNFESGEKKKHRKKSKMWETKALINSVYKNELPGESRLNMNSDQDISDLALVKTLEDQEVCILAANLLSIYTGC